MSIKGKGRKKTIEHKNKIGLANKGNKRPDLTKRNLERWRKYHENLLR